MKKTTVLRKTNSSTAPLFRKVLLYSPIRFIVGFVAFCSQFTPAGLVAREANPWDVRIFAGFESGQTDRVEATVDGVRSVQSLDLDSGTLFGASVGYAWTDQLVTELEYTYRTAEFSGPADQIFQGSDEADIASVMIFANVYYRPVLKSLPKIRPRFGFGIGWLQETSMDIMTNGAEESFDGDGTAFQAILGVDYLVNDRWTFALDLHYYSAGSVDLASEEDSSRQLNLDYEGMSLKASVAYRF